MRDELRWSCTVAVLLENQYNTEAVPREKIKASKKQTLAMTRDHGKKKESTNRQFIVKA